MIRTLRFGRCALGLFFLVGGLTACDEARQPPARPNPDLQVECVPLGMDSGSSDGGTSLSCGSGEQCIQGRCYASCGGDSDCGPREECASSGVCIPSGDARPDSGTPPVDGGTDAGPPDPCDGVVCTGTEVCHPGLGECTECSALSVGVARGEPGFCEPDPICDIANGDCAPKVAATCQPCNLASDCVGTADPMFSGECTSRDVFELSEQVCLLACTVGDDTCPAGTLCDATLLRCIPTAGVSCTTWLRGVARQACFTDADCNPRGDTGAVVTGACVGAIPPPDAGMPDAGVDGGPLDAGMSDGGAGTPGECRQPCGTDGDCAGSGFTCDDTFFCAPPLLGT
ncbi:MAG: hypothetical protein AB8I08_07595 [Sandaracinaceae bacterium]